MIFLVFRLRSKNLNALKRQPIIASRIRQASAGQVTATPYVGEYPTSCALKRQHKFCDKRGQWANLFAQCRAQQNSTKLKLIFCAQAARASTFFFSKKSRQNFALSEGSGQTIFNIFSKAGCFGYIALSANKNPHILAN